MERGAINYRKDGFNDLMVTLYYVTPSLIVYVSIPHILVTRQDGERREGEKPQDYG